MTRRLVIILLYLAAAALLSAAVGWGGFTSALDEVERRGRSDLRLTSQRLTAQLQSYGELAVALADRPELRAHIAERGNLAEVTAVIQRHADMTGSVAVLLTDAEGRVLASTNGAPDDYGRLGGPVVERARQGALGSGHGVDAGSGRRLYSFAAPIYSEAGPVEGTVVVRADLGLIELDWAGDPVPVFFSDAAGVIFAANRFELLFRSRTEPAERAIYAGVELRPFIDHRPWQAEGRDLWWVDAGPYIPSAALHMVQELPVIGMRGEALIDLSPAIRIAALGAAATAALCLGFGAFLFLLSERRRALALRLAVEARANAVLEARVEKRTAALRAANERLKAEVHERMEAEAALRRAQADLVQAGKLSALGQMSAGLSHELNQPLMAIRSFAENAESFLERGSPERAAQNLGRIGDLARRMGRIIRNLRAFARQESEPIGRVDLGAVVEAVLEMAEGRVRQAGIEVAWMPPPAPVMVRGGEVRLQQVVLNLVSNGIDAMAGSAAARLEIAIEPGAPVRLRVADSGPGIAEPDRIFDPFYSTKEVGASEGMGLGLSISYGLVQSFGGNIRGVNRPEGGAEFTVELQPADMEAAA
ncbi:sensor histidine kinase [Vannielia litorea]|uniref:C4-dicarboxylate transport sensor protein DctB n=1 Tax=Vannielia litorea TaxID=1217970 RepID=A0A1N6FRK2_9RHOB|nr:ATP-binding protein [Vannielia litorea]SIN97867.1 two-component system, NtrC family, C4-dicarboxylate transport sensor histidine kinase DctB [Vannielia litorea]